MKNKEKFILALLVFCILIIIVISVIALVLFNGTEKIQDAQLEEQGDAKTVEQREVKLTEVTSPTTFYTVQNIVEAYEKYIHNVSDINQRKDTVLKLLDTSYIKENSITIGNIESFIQFDSDDIDRLITLDMKALEQGQFKQYSVHIQVVTKSGKRTQEYYVITLDDYNSTYIIKPVNNVKNISEVELKEIEEINKIENNEYNKYSYVRVSDSEMVVNYLSQYTDFMINNPQQAYNKMTEEYRTKRFGSLDNFQAYIKANASEINSVNAKQYIINRNNETTQYVIKDQYENLYIFDVKAVLDYTVRLDTYTLEEEKFNTTYDSAAEQMKVQMNIDKFFQMINRHDYRTSYSVLADSFKQNSMKTEQEFENIAKKTFFSYNKVEYLELKELGNNTYSCNLKLTDLTGGTGEKNITIIMQLQENRKFAMSFSA